MKKHGGLAGDVLKIHSYVRHMAGGHEQKLIVFYFIDLGAFKAAFFIPHRIIPRNTIEVSFYY